MAGNISDQTTVLSNVSLTGNLLAAGIGTDGTGVVSNVSSSRVTAGTVAVLGGATLSGVTLDLRTNAVIPSSITYAGGASISGLTIGQWGFVFNASGFSIAFSSGKTAYFFGGSTLSAAIT